MLLCLRKVYETKGAFLKMVPLHCPKKLPSMIEEQKEIYFCFIKHISCFQSKNLGEGSGGGYLGKRMDTQST